MPVTRMRSSRIRQFWQVMRAGVRGLRTILVKILSRKTLLDLVPLADMSAVQPIVFAHPLD
jgi:hypothetical protein